MNDSCRACMHDLGVTCFVGPLHASFDFDIRCHDDVVLEATMITFRSRQPLE